MKKISRAAGLLSILAMQEHSNLSEVSVPSTAFSLYATPKPELTKKQKKARAKSKSARKARRKNRRK